MKILELFTPRHTILTENLKKSVAVLFEFCKPQFIPAAILTLLCFPIAALAQPPLYNAEYNAKFKGIKARATMAVREVAEAEAEEQYQFDSQVYVSLFGKRLVGVNELSTFGWDHDLDTAIPLSYKYEQTGIGGRIRTADFDHGDNSLVVRLDEDEPSMELSLTENTQDRLTMYYEIQRQLKLGMDDLYINILDKAVIEAEHYKKVAEEVIETPLGKFNSIKLEKIRDPQSERKTILWIAPDWDYILLKLEQHEPGGSNLEINLKAATTSVGAVTGL